LINRTKERKLRVIDLFCGAGGFSEGFRQAGFDIIWAVDIWQPAVTTHHKNHPASDTLLGDVEKIAYLPDEEFHQVVPDSEIIIGSPPCVAFSNSNKSGKADKSKGIRLVEAFLRIVARKKYKEGSILKYWIFENVPNVEPHVEKEYSSQALNLTELEGDFPLKVKHFSSHIYNSQYFGVPSKRIRFICGDFPEPEQIIKSDENLTHLNHVLIKLGAPQTDPERIVTDPNYDFQMLSGDITDHHYIQEIAEFEWQKAKRLKLDKGYMGKMSFPENVNRPARTVMATMSFSARESMVFGYDENRYRAPTIREVASLMSFPIDYRFYGESIGLKYQLVGNAVPPKMALAFAKAIAQKENMPITENYVPLAFENNGRIFTNLNWQTIPIREEKPKLPKARFRYHVPYLIIKRYRVELTNHHSDFENNKFRWDVEIHFSQGPQAKVFKPEYSESWLSDKLRSEVYLFIKKKAAKIVSANKFQEVYCQPDIFRKKKNLAGPMELLLATKSFLVSLEIEKNDVIKIQENNKIIEIPIIIAIGYFMLSEIVSRINGGNL
jgi:DNA (cytosine-5)-methyltransferase 1